MLLLTTILCTRWLTTLLLLYAYIPIGNHIYNTHPVWAISHIDYYGIFFKTHQKFSRLHAGFFTIMVTYMIMTNEVEICAYVSKPQLL